MTFEDGYGAELTTTSKRAASAYRDGVDRLPACKPGAGAAFKAALAEDPTFALAYAGRAVIARRWGRLDEAAEAHAYIQDRKNFGKVILTAR